MSRLPTIELDLRLPLRLATMPEIWSPNEYDIQWSLERYVHDVHSYSSIRREHLIAPGLRPDFTLLTRSFGMSFLCVVEVKWRARDAAVEQLRRYLSAASGMADYVHGILIAKTFSLTSEPEDVELIQIAASVEGRG